MVKVPLSGSTFAGCQTKLGYCQGKPSGLLPAFQLTVFTLALLGRTEGSVRIVEFKAGFVRFLRLAIVQESNGLFFSADRFCKIGRLRVGSSEGVKGRGVLSVCSSNGS